jgi:hypothetical protein
MTVVAVGFADQVPDLLLERYRLGELPPAEHDRLRERLAEDEDLGRRLTMMEWSDRDLARDGVIERLIEQARDAARRPVLHDRRSPPLRWLIPMAAAVVIGAVLLRPAPETERIKGASAALMIYRNTPAGSETLADNDLARTGDVLRIGYRVTEAVYGVILSVDGRGSVTPHLPASEAEPAVPFEPGKVVLLPNAFELDDAPRVERFYLITAPAPFTTTAVVDAVRRASNDGSVSLPGNFDHTVFSLRKDSGR